MQSLASSFRDPSGFIYSHENSIYRQVNRTFASQFEEFIDSGLYEALVEKGILVPHEDRTDSDIPRGEDCYKVLQPSLIPFISYPYEWSFSQLKDAAILTLRAQSTALKFGFALKDASAYNVQFLDGKPVFIDTLSFERYTDGKPWVAYRQFCQHFLAPLALMSYIDIDLGKLLVTHIDGIPLALASTLLPARTRLSYGLQVHIHLHAKMQANYADAAGEDSSRRYKASEGGNLSLSGLRAIIESLAALVQKLEWKPPKTEWGNYYDHTNYSDSAAEQKRELLEQFLGAIEGPVHIIQDLGANTGEYSRVAAPFCSLVVSQDIDPVAVERNYRGSKEAPPSNILPLVQNLVAPSPAIGWANEERDSFRKRSCCDVLMALALIHHIAISNNTPLTQIASLFASLGKWLIIEFVPKSDSQVIRLLETREDIFSEYTEQGFEEAFSQYFSIERKSPVSGSERSLYLLKSL